MAKPPFILIVDDDPHIVHVLSVKLVQAGFRVACAADGYRALQIVNDQAPDLLIADGFTSMLSGRQLCESLLQKKATSNIPVILLAGRSHKITPGDNYTTNIKSVIGKPFRPSDVLDQIVSLLDTTDSMEIAKAS